MPTPQPLALADLPQVLLPQCVLQHIDGVGHHYARRPAGQPRSGDVIGLSESAVEALVEQRDLGLWLPRSDLGHVHLEGRSMRFIKPLLFRIERARQPFERYLLFTRDTRLSRIECFVAGHCLTHTPAQNALDCFALGRHCRVFGLTQQQLRGHISMCMHDHQIEQRILQLTYKARQLIAAA